MPYIGNITQDFNVSNAMLDTDSVTSIKIVDGTIEGADIAANLDLSDNQKIRFGTGNDLQIFHDGTNSFISDTGSGALRIVGSQLLVRNAADNENMIVASQNGTVELYYDNSKKFETTSGGVGISGFLDIPSDSNRLRLGASNDLQIYHNGTINYIEAVSGDLQLIGNSSEKFAVFVQNGAVELYHNNTKKFETNADGVVVNGVTVSTGNIQINNDTAKIRLGASQDLEIYHDGSHSRIVNGTNGGTLRLQTAGSEEGIVIRQNAAVELYYDNSKKFETTSGGVTVTGTVTATSFSGETVVGDPSPQLGNSLDMNGQSINGGDSAGVANNRIKLGAGDDLQIYHDGSHSRIDEVGTGNLMIQSNNAVFIKKGTSEDIARFNVDGAVELHYDNSKKLSTTSSGIQVEGSGILNGAGTNTTTLTLKNATDTTGTKLGHSSNSDRGFIQVTESGADFGIQVGGANTSNMRFEAFGDATTATRICNGTEEMITAAPNGAVELYHDNAKRLDTHSSGITVHTSSGVDLKIGTNDSIFRTDANMAGIHFSTTAVLPTNNSGTVVDNSINLGSTSHRWANIYTTDLKLSNEGSQNDVDGTWGNYTIQEGHEDLFLINHRTGKKFKFNLTEVA